MTFEEYCRIVDTLATTSTYEKMSPETWRNLKRHARRILNNPRAEYQSRRDAVYVFISERFHASLARVLVRYPEISSLNDVLIKTDHPDFEDFIPMFMREGKRTQRFPANFVEYIKEAFGTCDGLNHLGLVPIREISLR